MPTKGPTQIIVETVGAGTRSQSASLICAGGVSAVISSSDLDGITFHPGWGICHQSNRALPSLAKPPIVEKLWLDRSLEATLELSSTPQKDGLATMGAGKAATLID